MKLPQGFRAAAVHAGIKTVPGREDVVLVLTDRPAAVAGVYTTNRVFAAPVALDRARTPSDHMRGVVINSGNANACTGAEGERDALAMTHLAAEACGVAPEEMLVMSTGIIGQLLPMDRVAEGIQRAAADLGSTAAHFDRALRGIMTTDTRPKSAHRSFTLGSKPILLTGMAKGSGMIGPRMATMLSVVMTDAAVSATDLQATVSRVADRSFNCVSVEGHMSTNDTLLVFASGAAGGLLLQGSELLEFERQLESVCIDLARQIADDGEGATHLIEIRVEGADSEMSARQIARAIADSPLVKTAFAGNDPNWGRIVSAAGYAGVPFEVSQSLLEINGHLLFQGGRPAAFDPEEVSRSMAAERESHVRLIVGQGSGTARFWTCDLTVEYVHINADYHT